MDIIKEESGMKKILKNIDYIALALCIALPLVVGIIGSYFVASSVNDWYETLAKPVFNPPNWLFGPAWTTLYVLMGVASYLVMKSTKYRKDKHVPALFYGVQLLLNLGWSIIFFGLQMPALALVEIVVLLGAIIATMVVFWRYSKAAVWLFVPYIAWTLFATALNAAIVILN